MSLEELLANKLGSFNKYSIGTHTLGGGFGFLLQNCLLNRLFIEPVPQMCFEGKWLQNRLRADKNESRSLLAVEIQGHQRGGFYIVPYLIDVIINLLFVLLASVNVPIRAFPNRDC